MSIKSIAKFISLIGFFLLVGCAGQKALPTTAITPSPKPTLTPTKKPPLPTSTLRPSSTPESTKDTSLTNREPSVEELKDYLQEDNTWNFEGFFDWIGGGETRFTNEDVTGDGKADIVGRPPSRDEIITLITHLDVNGDGQDELIVYGNYGLLVFFWDGDRYIEAYRDIWGYSRGGPPTHEMSFQDWTNDGIPEIVYDYSFLGGGTGYMDYSTVRSIIFCTASGCENVWNDSIVNHIDDSNYGGLRDGKLEMRPFITEDGKPAIRVISEGFSIFIETTVDEDLHSLYTYPSKLLIYTWSGNQFELTDEKIISLESRINSMSSLAATSSAGANAKIVAKPNNIPGSRNDFCQLIINGHEVGKQFGCRDSFTTVEWRDITGDGAEEVVVIAYSAGFPYDDGWNTLSDEVCMHQRLIAYQSDGSNNTEIANVAGCVIQKDLYGVRLEDYDGDGIPEIFAAPNGDLNNRAYKWNGKKFVYLSDFPLEK